jgi:hypothetical protein
MAGSKPTEAEKDQIRQLVREGYSVQEVQQRFPHIDGRSISGTHMRIVYNMGSPESRPAAETAPLPPGPSQPPVPATPPGATSGFKTSPHPDDQGIKTPQRESADVTGFTPAAQTAHSPQGFLPSYREYFIVKKLDLPNSGVRGTEYPPFGVMELIERYEPGDYEVQHYREGRLFNTYREKVSTKARGGTGVIEPEKPRVDSPSDLFLKAMDVYHRMNHDSKVAVEQAQAVKAQADVARENAKGQVESAAMVGLVDIAREATRPKPNSSEPAVEHLFKLMQQDRDTGEIKIKGELDLIRERAKNDLELERVRLRSEEERLKADLANREKMQQDFIGKLQELDKDRQALWQKHYDDGIEQLRGLQGSIEKEMEDKKAWLKEYGDIQRKHVDEIIGLKKLMGGNEGSLKMAEIIRDGVVQGLDRVGARIDMLVDKGVIPSKVGVKGTQGTVNTAPASQAQEPAHEQEKKEDKVLTREQAREMSREPWFKELQDLIARDVKARINAKVPSAKPHGSMIGQLFIDKVNEDAKYRMHFHYLRSRRWEEVLEDADPGITPENKELFKHPEAYAWFDQFSGYLVQSWNASLGIS